MRQDQLGQGQGSGGVDGVRCDEPGDVEVGERSHRRRPQRAGVVDQQVEVPGPLDGGRELVAVRRVGDVTGHGRPHGSTEGTGGLLERVGAARIDDQPPALVGQRSREGQPEAAGGAGHQRERCVVDGAVESRRCRHALDPRT